MELHKLELALRFAEDEAKADGDVVEEAAYAIGHIAERQHEALLVKGDLYTGHGRRGEACYGLRVALKRAGSLGSCATFVQSGVSFSLLFNGHRSPSVVKSGHSVGVRWPASLSLRSLIPPVAEAPMH